MSTTLGLLAENTFQKRSLLAVHLLTTITMVGKDILLVNGKDWHGHPTGNRQTMGLYRNNQNGTFTDVTETAGLAVELYGLGVAVADYDNDGDDDLYISCLTADRLFQNQGDGTFLDATEAAGINNPGFGTSCAWLDYNRDGQPRYLRCQLHRMDA